MINIVHDSQDIFYRSPFGAVTCNTDVTLRIDVSSREALESVEIVIREDSMQARSFLMEMEEQRDGVCTYRAVIQMPCEPYITWYFFKVNAQSGTFYYANNEEGLGGVGQIYHINPIPFQITVYRSDYDTPSWYRESIVYQIFVDRFFNGNPSGEVLSPKPQSLIHSSWDATPFYVKDSRGDVIKWDFYGGNIEGIIKKLDYIQELGVGCIYLNPVFESPSNHKYDVSDYKKIDGMFGDESDMERLCKLAAEKGIKIVLDGVFSHTGSDSIYFNRYSSYAETGAYQSKDSKYYSWYKFDDYPDKYKGWWGIKSLPEVNELESSYMEFIIKDSDSVIGHWMKRGIKGWRLDVADELPDEFIEELRKRVKEIDAEAVIIGEVWEDASNKISYEKRRNYFSGLELDSVTNYPFRNIMTDYLLGRISSNHAGKRLMGIYENYPKPAFYSNLNLIGSHDVVRILTVLGEAPDESGLRDYERYGFRLHCDRRMLAVQRLKLLVAVQMIFPGVPCIYYADEAGMEGYSDPFNRASFPWGREDKEILSWYRTVAEIRNSSDAAKRGAWKLLPSGEDIFSFMRMVENPASDCRECIIVAINRDGNKSIWKLDAMHAQLEEGCVLEDAVTGKAYRVSASGVEIDIEGLGVRILKCAH